MVETTKKPVLARLEFLESELIHLDDRTLQLAEQLVSCANKDAASVDTSDWIIGLRELRDNLRADSDVFDLVVNLQHLPNLDSVRRDKSWHIDAMFSVDGDVIDHDRPLAMYTTSTPTKHGVASMVVNLALLGCEDYVAHKLIKGLDTPGNYTAVQNSINSILMRMTRAYGTDWLERAVVDTNTLPGVEFLEQPKITDSSPHSIARQMSLKFLHSGVDWTPDQPEYRLFAR